MGYKNIVVCKFCCCTITSSMHSMQKRQLCVNKIMVAENLSSKKHTVGIIITVADSGGGKEGLPFKGLPSRVLSMRKHNYLCTLRPTLTVVEYHNK